MRILVADDEPVSRRILESTLQRLGWDTVTATDGDEALRLLTQADAPEISLLDWMMPGLEGVEVCRRLRAMPEKSLLYLILLTSKSESTDVSTGLAAGANDYLTKPFNQIELAARINVAARVVELQRGLAARVTELEDALLQVRRLQGLLPICSYCRKVRDEADYWQNVEEYLSTALEVDITHGVCPDCLERIMREMDESPA